MTMKILLAQCVYIRPSLSILHIYDSDIFRIYVDHPEPFNDFVHELSSETDDLLLIWEGHIDMRVIKTIDSEPGECVVCSHVGQLRKLNSEEWEFVKRR